MAAFYAWLRRHPRLVDGVLALALALAGIGNGIGTGRYWLIPVALGMCLPVIFRRGHPVAAFAVTVAIGAVQVVVGAIGVHPVVVGTRVAVVGVRPIASDLAIVVLLYTLAAYTNRRASVTGLGICLLGSGAAMLSWKPTALSALTWLLVGSIMFAGPCLIAWVLGDSMRYRRAYYANLEERAARLERDRDAQAQIAAAAERARIARELHDVVAHNVSVMVVQADGAAYAIDADPARAREALMAIAAAGRQALTEMRALLGVLRRTGADGAAALAPVPGLSQLDDLLDQARAAGLPVTCTVDGEPRELPGGTALAAYRIIQESLTNTRKHAGPGAEATVRLRYAGDRLDLEIADNGIGAAAGSDGAGHGLTGMRERAAMYGGSVIAGPRPDGGFGVVASLPIRSAERAGVA